MEIQEKRFDSCGWVAGAQRCCAPTCSSRCLAAAGEKCGLDSRSWQSLVRSCI